MYTYIYCVYCSFNFHLQHGLQGMQGNISDQITQRLHSFIHTLLFIHTVCTPYVITKEQLMFRCSLHDIIATLHYTSIHYYLFSNYYYSHYIRSFYGTNGEKLLLWGEDFSQLQNKGPTRPNNNDSLGDWTVSCQEILLDTVITIWSHCTVTGNGAKKSIYTATNCASSPT